jgi:23S rRNA pseudouridine955/2504/2580 synthase|tara:strand:- start:317 stop:1309 length:993 start_codon:yes stop_codon:yes gene_type:complete
MSDESEKKPKVEFVDISADEAGQRVDNFLLAKLKGVPRSKIYRIVRKGEVRVNKGRVKPEYKLQPGDRVRVPPVSVPERGPQALAGPSLLRLLEGAVIFENDALLVINKPSGLAVHGGSGITLGLIESLRQSRPEARFLELIHRIDRDTSGCIMIAKKRSMLRYMQQSLREKSLREHTGGAASGGIEKVYWALVDGAWPKRKKKIDLPLKKIELPSGENMVRIDASGKPSLTHFSVLTLYSCCTLIEARPITGRTHQIRVHAQHVGHSLIGDVKYGLDSVNASMKVRGFKRLFLHAAKLRFKLPDEDSVTEVVAPLPDDLKRSLASLAGP